MPKKLVFGGQAIIEGVLIMGSKYVSMAVRRKNRIITKHEKLKKRSAFQKLPLVRGVVTLIQMMVTGFKALTWSADQQLDKHEKIKKSELTFSVILSLVFGILLFIALPLYLTKLVHHGSGVIFNVIDGIIRVAVFLLYIFAISFLKDVKRLFQYHGAEHMSIHCLEANKKLTVGNVKKFSPLHPRCGTSFIIMVLIVSIFVFSLVVTENFLVKLLSRVILLPVIAGLSYELLKVTAKYQGNMFMKALSQPGLWLQKITTRQPEDRMIEVALRALKNGIKLEKK